MGDDRVRSARLLAICVEAELARGDIQQASLDAEELSALTADHPLPVLRARAELARGRVAEIRGDAAGASTAYQRGLRILADNEWPLLRAELHLALARLLADTDLPAAITEVRDGLSNADIANRQHNSVRTIEHHVSAILAKLGLRSRAEAAAYAASLETDADPIALGSKNVY
jgi:ATP/maltotriose-dependent transcriptional regulator MalT